MVWLSNVPQRLMSANVAIGRQGRNLGAGAKLEKAGHCVPLKDLFCLWTLGHFALSGYRAVSRLALLCSSSGILCFPTGLETMKLRVQRLKPLQQ